MPQAKGDDVEAAEDDDEELSEGSEELSYGEDDDEEDSDEEEEDDDETEEEDDDKAEEEEADDEPMKDIPANLDDVEDASNEKVTKERKRKRKVDNEDLEGKYLNKIAAEEEAERAGKRQKNEVPGDNKEDVAEDANDNADDDDEVPVHESLAKDDDTSNLEKAARTVFLANVSTEAISSKTAKKTLMTHLSSILDKDAKPVQTIESIRFRSVAFSGGALPKRAAYITKSLMDSTTKSANAYVVYSTLAAARAATTKLNGTLVLDRHIRVDSVAHPSPTDHRRCIFVGNLGFVDDETVLNTDADGVTTEKKRGKVAADVEEGLWRTFGTKGKVENVRVVRDPKTRVGKGFAYVQFYVRFRSIPCRYPTSTNPLSQDANDVEAALLLNEKKFPPMLPRKLRVTRAKDPRKTLLAQERAKAKNAPPNGNAKNTKYTPKMTPEQQSMIGRTGKLLGRSAAAQQRHGKRREPRVAPDAAPDAEPAMKTPEQIIFEGRRASSKDGKPKDLKFGKKVKSKGRPQNRGAKRASEWKRTKSSS